MVKIMRKVQKHSVYIRLCAANRPFMTKRTVDFDKLKYSIFIFQKVQIRHENLMIQNEQYSPTPPPPSDIFYLVSPIMS